MNCAHRNASPDQCFLKTGEFSVVRWARQRRKPIRSLRWPHPHSAGYSVSRDVEKHQWPVCLQDALRIAQRCISPADVMVTSWALQKLLISSLLSPCACFRFSPRRRKLRIKPPSEADKTSGLALFLVSLLITHPSLPSLRTSH